MRILYGVVGEGMGHATRSRVILEHLLAGGHRIRVVVSGRAHEFLVERFRGRKNIEIEEIHGFNLNYGDNALKINKSILTNLAKAPKGLARNFGIYAKVAEDKFKAECVVSDFESWAYFYARVKGIPVISIDNQQVINRCKHEKEVGGRRGFSTLITQLAVRIKLPGAYHYLITSFFYPPVRKKRTTLIPPILRKEILEAKREPREHVLVYQTSKDNSLLVPALQKLDYEFRVYGMGREGEEKNVKLRAFSETGFVDDLRTARAVIAGGGYSLMGEAVHLHVPMMSIPITKQYEQELNARYLQHLGYGEWAQSFDIDRIAPFLENTDEYAHNLETYESVDNSMLFKCVDELMRWVESGSLPPDRLETKARGSYGG